MPIELFVDSEYLSPYAMSVFVALRHKQIDFTLRTVDLGAGEQHSQTHAQRALTSRVPVLGVDGWSLCESSAIAEYLDDAWPERPLYPADARERARARELQAWLRSDLATLRAERSTEGVFLGRRGGALSPAAQQQADKLLRAASALITPGRTTLFAQWCIADTDLALMLQRLIRPGDPVHDHLAAYVEHQWRNADVLAWRALPRPGIDPADDDAPPPLDDVDHLHVFVTDRPRAEAWYARVLGLERVPELERWADDGGPLTLGDASGSVHLALFERPAQPCRSTIALRVNADAFLRWRTRLVKLLGRPIDPENHALSWSLYFSDPDGNPYEITTYEYQAVREKLAA